MKRICFAALSLALLSGAAAQFSAVPLPSAEGKTKYPLVLKTPFGTTTLKTGPRRVAVVGSIHDLEAALALGVTPVVSTARAWPWHDENGAKKIALRLEEGEDGQPFEKIAAAKPDVILAATDYDLANNYKRLSQIAPVVALTSYKGEPSDADWKDVIRLHGRVFDLAGRAENRIAVRASFPLLDTPGVLVRVHATLKLRHPARALRGRRLPAAIPQHNQHHHEEHRGDQEQHGSAGRPCALPRHELDRGRERVP